MSPALLSRCTAHVMDSDCRILRHLLKGISGNSESSSVTGSQLTNSLRVYFISQPLDNMLKLWHVVSYYRMNQDFIAAGEKCDFTCLRVSHGLPAIPRFSHLSLSSSIFLLFNVLRMLSGVATL